jgi:SAM-dependent methyltransferase
VSERRALSYFESRDAAERYLGGRPYFHPLVIKKIRDFLRLREPIPLALDVACGTGQSTVALKEISSRVVGTEVSREMLALAPREAGVRYVEAPAEDLPFADGSFQLITVALAFHWFDRSRFLAETRRVLEPSGWLVIYDNGFFGEMKENPKHERWYRENYLVRYPSPPRKGEPLTDDECRKHGLRLVERESYANEVSFSAEELASYLMTQSNVTAAIEDRAESPESVRTWLISSLSPMFEWPRGTFRFGGVIDYLQASSNAVSRFVPVHSRYHLVNSAGRAKRGAGDALDLRSPSRA